MLLTIYVSWWARISNGKIYCRDEYHYKLGGVCVSRLCKSLSFYSTNCNIQSHNTLWREYSVHCMCVCKCARLSLFWFASPSLCACPLAPLRPWSHSFPSSLRYTHTSYGNISIFWSSPSNARGTGATLRSCTRSIKHSLPPSLLDAEIGRFDYINTRVAKQMWCKWWWQIIWQTKHSGRSGFPFQEIILSIIVVVITIIVRLTMTAKSYVRRCTCCCLPMSTCECHR